MHSSFYKILFELQLKHSSAPAELCTSFGLYPTQACLATFQNFRMKYRTAPGKITVYYSGNEVIDTVTPANRTLDQFPTISDKTVFDFGVRLLDNTIINDTRIPSSLVTEEGKVIHKSLIKPAVVGLQFGNDAATGSYESFKVYNTNDAEIASKRKTIAKEENGQYNCTTDLTNEPAGIYAFELGSKKPKYYVDTLNELNGAYGLIRLVYKAAGAGAWVRPNVISPRPAVSDYNLFEYTFQTL